MDSLSKYSAVEARKVLAHWRLERAFRIGRYLSGAGLILSLLTTVTDLIWSTPLVVGADLMLVAGCTMTLYWSRKADRRDYFWWPIYGGFWCTSLATYVTTGGLNSPFFGVGITLLYILGEILDPKGRSNFHLWFAFLHLPAFMIIERFYPLGGGVPLPHAFTATLTALVLTGVYVCVRAVMKTESDLSLEFSEREMQLREAQSIAKVGSWEWNVQSDRILWSDELFRIFDVEKEKFDPSYRAYLARLNPEMREQIAVRVERSVATGDDFSFENRVRTANGERFVFSRGRVIKDENGRTLKMVGTSQDISERKQTESELLEAREELEKRVEERTLQLEHALLREKAAKEAAENANQAKMQFLANMSHEIRTPMNSILGFTEILSSERFTPEKTKEFMDRIRVSGNQLMRLIDDILDLSKFEAGQIPIQKTVVALKDLVEDAVNSFQPAMKAKELDLELLYRGNIPQKIFTDGNRLSQIIINLLSNAIKFSETGKIRVTVSAAAGELSLDVEDSGIGISAGNQATLFQLFSQGDSSVARKYGGSGLGLALSRRISEAMGGRLELIRSQPGAGSHFRLQAPIEAVPVPSVESAPAHAASADGTAAAGRMILLAEDSPDNAYLICHFIRPLGYQVDVATDGLQAVEAVKQKSYDCILMDIQMPGMDGLEATRRIRAMGFTNPIIALTAHALAAEAERSIQAGCNQHLTKPVSRADLAQALSSQWKH